MTGAREVDQRKLADMVTAPKFERPWRPAPPPPLSLPDLARVCEALKNLDRRPRPKRAR